MYDFHNSMGCLHSYFDSCGVSWDAGLTGSSKNAPIHMVNSWGELLRESSVGSVIWKLQFFPLGPLHLAFGFPDRMVTGF